MQRIQLRKRHQTINHLSRLQCGQILYEHFKCSDNAFPTQVPVYVVFCWAMVWHDRSRCAFICHHLCLRRLLFHCNGAFVHAKRLWSDKILAKFRDFCLLYHVSRQLLLHFFFGISAEKYGLNLLGSKRKIDRFLTPISNNERHLPNLFPVAFWQRLLCLSVVVGAASWRNCVCKPIYHLYPNDSLANHNCAYLLVFGAEAVTV